MSYCVYMLGDYFIGETHADHVPYDAIILSEYDTHIESYNAVLTILAYIKTPQGNLKNKMVYQRISDGMTWPSFQKARAANFLTKGELVKKIQRKDNFRKVKVFN